MEKLQRDYTTIFCGHGPVTVTDVVNEKLNNIHKKLYNNALNKFLKYNNISRLEYNIIEIKPEEYDEPSNIIIKSKKPPFKLYKNLKSHSLKEYWNTEYIESIQKDISLLMLDLEEVHDLKIIYIDYVKGKCKMRSEQLNITVNVPFCYINDSTVLSNDFTLLNTFTTLRRLKNNI